MADKTNEREHGCRGRKSRIILLGLGVCLVVLAIASFLVGRYPISPDKVVGILASGVVPIDQFWTDQEALIFFNVRLPRVLLAMLVGCSLSAAGAAYQGTFQNPLVSPDILGASQGAAFGAAVAATSWPMAAHLLLIPINLVGLVLFALIADPKKLLAKGK